MAKYTGRRIVPKHAGEWDIRKEYEELQIVLDTDSGNSFISNLPVPKGTALSDEKYWSLFSLHSEQIAEAEEHLTQTAEDIRSELSETENRINKNVSDTEGRINESLSSTENKVNTSLSETENRVTARVENAKSDLTAKVAAAEQQMNQSAQNVAQTNKALNARMDQIAKGRTSDTEVLDARVDSEGNTFDNLGAAIRSIYPKAKEGLDALQESKVDANYDATGELTEGITVNTINGETQKFEHVQTTALIPVDTACQKVYYTGQVFNWIGVAGYDANGTFVASILDSRDTEQPQEYKEKELEIPEGVFQIRASSYAKDLNLKVCGESAKLWNQVQRERQNQKKMAIEIEALRSADDALAKETMTSLNLPFLYDGVSNIWEGSSPVLQTYYVPLTVLQSVFVQEIQFTLRTIGETTLTVMLESEEGEVFTQTVELVKGDNKIILFLHRFIDEGAYKLRVRSTDKVLYYPVRPSTGKEIRNDFFSNEPSGNVEYDYKNRLIAFMGKILIGTGKVDTTLSYSGMAADAAVVGQAFKDAKAAETEYRCLMVGMPGTVNGKHYGSSSSYKLDGKTVVNYAMGKGGWSAEDLNLATFESASNINPFYDEKTKGFSLKACLDKYRTLADNGMTRLIPGETAGTEVKDANAYDLCTPTHVVINLNHNSSLAEYKANIPDVVKTIKREYPDIIVILMSIDETGTYFPAKYPEYRASEITLGGLHSKNVSIYQYFCDELQDEANGVYVCSGHLIQPAVESYPTLDYVSADSVGRQSGRVLHMAYGRGQYGGPNWHPNNYAHCAWGYQLYALVKYTLALQDMK